MKDSLLVLRLFRIGHLPPARYALDSFRQAALPVHLVEFGNVTESPVTTSPFPRWRIASPWARYFPRRARASLILLGALFQVTLRVLRLGKPSLVVSNGLQEQAVALWLQLFFGIPFVAHVHEVHAPDELSPLNRGLLWLEKLVMKRASLLIFPGHRRAALYRERHRLKQPIHVVFNCPPLRKEVKRVPHEGPWRMVYVGGLGKLSAVPEAVRSLELLPDVELSVAGWGDIPQTASRAHYVGEASAEEKWKLMEASDFAYCVYFPSSLRTRLGATASSKLFEALAAGLPVIASNDPDFLELVEGLGVGTCAEEITPEGIAGAVKRLIPRIGECSANARRMHETIFNFEHQFEVALGDIKNLFSSRSRPRVRWALPAWASRA